MLTTCTQCGLVYDDTYRLTICPHQGFAMNTTVTGAGGVVGVAHTVEELEELMAEAAGR